MAFYQKLSQNVRPALGALVACGVAAIACVAFRSAGTRPMILLGFLLLGFLLLVTGVALISGAVAGAIAACLIATMFSVLLLPPIGSIAVADPNQRAAIAWFLMGGVSISLLFGKTLK